jgi:acetyltransferase-like isoleucine patch superfamily enzyme
LTIAGKVSISGKGRIYAGRNFVLRSGCGIFADENATIRFRNDVRLNYGVGILTQKLVEIGDEALIGDRTIIQDSDWHGIDGNPQK